MISKFNTFFFSLSLSLFSMISIKNQILVNSMKLN